MIKVSFRFRGGVFYLKQKQVQITEKRYEIAERIV